MDENGNEEEYGTSDTYRPVGCDSEPRVVGGHVGGGKGPGD